MKKIISILSVLVILVMMPFLTACDYTKNENHTNTALASNGGSVVFADGYMYYIGGAEDRKNENSNNTNSAVYKVAVDANGNRTGDATRLTSTINGFADGSLFVFGEFVYYSTPSVQRDNTGSLDQTLTSFCRIKTDGSHNQVLYTTKSETEDLQYTYYLTGEKTLYLVVVEDTSIFSILVGSKTKDVKEIATDVASAVLAENNGTGDVNKYIFYTQSPIDSDTIQTGNKIFKVLPDGTAQTELSSGKDITLLQIKNGRLYYQYNSIIYSTDAENLLTQNAVSYGTFTDFILLSDGGVLGVVSSKTYYYNWSSGTLVSKLVYSGSPKFVCETGGFVYFLVSDYLYRIDVNATEPTATKLCTAVISNDVGSYMTVEIFKNYAYFLTEEVLTDEAGTEYSIYHLSYITLDTITSGGNTAIRLNK